MVKRAGCASTDCECHMLGGHGVHIAGNGSDGSPYVVSTGEFYGILKGKSSQDVTVNVTGVGSAQAPYVIETTVKNPGLTSADARRYVTSGTWIKPPNATVMVLVTVVGAGGGGGSGAGKAGAATSVPGKGGGGGGWSQALFHGSWLPPAVTVTVGTGGAGGIAQADQVFGNPGIDGGVSRFGAFLLAGGGAGGRYDDAVTNELPQRSIGVESGGTTTRKLWRPGQSTFKAAGSGGSGGDLGSADPANIPGGDVYSYQTTAQIPPTGHEPTHPGIPAPVGTAAGGSGGQGGWGYVPGVGEAQSGKPGGFPGGGGGGGGEADTGHMPGSGGRGADGWVEIVTWSALAGQWDTTDPALQWDQVGPTITWDNWITWK